jgi:hypothetical protein
MIINVLHKGVDRITVDIRCKEIRFLKDFAHQGPVSFHTIDGTDADSYEFLYNNNKGALLTALSADLEMFTDIQVDPKDLVIEGV